MLRLAARSQELQKLGRFMLQGATTRSACTSSGASDNAISNLIKAVKNSNSSSFAAGGLTTLKSTIEPSYAATSSQGLSTAGKLMLMGVAGWFLYRADQQARAHEWIVDLSLNVLQSAWLISFLSFLPFRAIFVSLRGIAPHTGTPLTALRPTVYMKP